MADSYHIIDGQMVPFHGGRKDTNTDAWRDATPMELQLQSELCAAERALEEAAAALKAAQEDAARLDWLDHDPASVDRLTGYLGDDDCWIARKDCIRVSKHATIRQAIDQARGKGALND